jgi:hypothetical protein
MPFWFGSNKGMAESFLNRPAESTGINNYGERMRTLCKNYDNKVVKVIQDTLKTGKYGHYVQRLIELMTDGDSIMANIRRYVQEYIMGMKVDENSCFSILESLENASCLDLREVDRVIGDVRTVYREYRRDIAGNLLALKNEAITEEDFNNALESIIHYSGEQLRELSSDRVALAFSAYRLSLENGHTSQSFPFLTVLDGMVALLSDVKTVDFYEIKLNRDIPDNATHLIVYNRRCRLPENIDPAKTYFGDVSLMNGSYEIHRDLKGNVSLIVPKTAKPKLNSIPYSDTAKFSIKVSYKASELLPEHQNGEYVTQLMKENPVTFRETTMHGNTQYCVYAGDVWVGTAFEDQANRWVLRKEVMHTLMNKEYAFVGIPRTGVKTDSNSFLTSSGIFRTAQVLTFVQR